MPSVDSFAQPEQKVAFFGRWNRRRYALLGLFLVGMLLAWGVQQIVLSTVSSGRSPAIALDRIDTKIPSPALTPEEVVSRQMESLRAATTDNDRLIECYSLAAPSNRAATGPFENFSELVRMEPYAALGECLEYQVGAAVIEADVAAVLVSLLTQQDESMAFRFVLVKQTQDPYEGCWMTEGVFQLVADGNTQAGEPATDGDLPDRANNSTRGEIH